MAEEKKNGKNAERALSAAEDKQMTDEDAENEVLEGFPDSMPKEARRFLQMGMMSIGASGNPASEISKKIDSSHISTYLETSREEMQKHYEERKQQKFFVGILVIVALIFFVIIIGMLKDNPDLLEKVIIAVAGFVSGTIGGYGFGKSHRDD